MDIFTPPPKETPEEKALRKKEYRRQYYRMYRREHTKPTEYTRSKPYKSKLDIERAGIDVRSNHVLIKQYQELVIGPKEQGVSETSESSQTSEN